MEGGRIGSGRYNVPPMMYHFIKVHCCDHPITLGSNGIVYNERHLFMRPPLIYYVASSFLILLMLYLCVNIRN